MKRFYQLPIWSIFLGPRCANCKYLLLILIPHLLAAILEGTSFGCILLAFSALEGKPPPTSLAFLNVAAWLKVPLTGMPLFYFYIFATVASQIVRGLISYIALYGTSALSLKVQTATQKKVSEQIFKFSFPFVSKYKIGDLNEHIKAPATFIPVFFEVLNRFSVSCFMIFGLILILFLISPSLTLFTLVLFGLFAFTQKFLLKNVIRASKEFTEQLLDFNHHVLQSLQGMRLIHIFHKQGYILKKIEELLGKLAHSARRLYSWNNAFPTVNETVSVMLVGCILILGSFLLAKNGEAVLASLLTYIALCYRLATRLQIAMAALSSIGVYYGGVLRLNEILEDKNKEYLPVSGQECKKWERRIEFRQVTFQYPNTSKYALNSLSFSIPKGVMTGIVGLSGAGKSSILDLILGLQKPVDGDILIDGVSLTEFTQESWRRRIGVVSQDTFVFNDTIEENIRFGNFTASHDEVQKAAVLAGIADLIEQLPLSYQTVIGERGYKFSGGERQRLALARALLKDPEILILDEATSSLDSQSEQIIQNSLDQMSNKTLIVVAHRLSTIVKAEQILVLEEGKIIEQGTHADLVLRNGRYSKLWELQTEYVR